MTMQGPSKSERSASGFKVLLDTDRVGKLTITFPIRFDIDGNDGLITDVPIRRRSVILDIEIAIIAVGQSDLNELGMTIDADTV